MSKSNPKYSAIVACEVCRVTARMLDYWVNTSVIKPAGVFECEYAERTASRPKHYRLFGFQNLVQIKLVREFREAGVSLQGLRYAIRELREKNERQWQRTWLVTDGRKVFKISRDPGVLVSLAKGEKGQHVFSVVALGQVAASVEKRLEAGNFKPFSTDRMKGKTLRWSQRTIA